MTSSLISVEKLVPRLISSLVPTPYCGDDVISEAKKVGLVRLENESAYLTSSKTAPIYSFVPVKGSGLLVRADDSSRFFYETSSHSIHAASLYAEGKDVDLEEISDRCSLTLPILRCALQFSRPRKNAFTHLVTPAVLADIVRDSVDLGVKTWCVDVEMKNDVVTDWAVLSLTSDENYRGKDKFSFLAHMAKNNGKDLWLVKNQGREFELMKSVIDPRLTCEGDAFYGLLDVETLINPIWTQEKGKHLAWNGVAQKKLCMIWLLDGKLLQDSKDKLSYFGGFHVAVQDCRGVVSPVSPLVYSDSIHIPRSEAGLINVSPPLSACGRRTRMKIGPLFKVTTFEQVREYANGKFFPISIGSFESPGRVNSQAFPFPPIGAEAFISFKIIARLSQLSETDEFKDTCLPSWFVDNFSLVPIGYNYRGGVYNENTWIGLYSDTIRLVTKKCINWDLAIREAAVMLSKDWCPFVNPKQVVEGEKEGW